MKRRDFLKSTTMGAVLMSTSALYSCRNQRITSGRIDCFQPNQNIPLIKEVDVFIAGGSSAAVSAAVKIARQGGRVFLTTDHPYLGEDIVGTFNYWNAGPPATELAKVLFPDKTPKNPLFYKRTLDNALLDHQIDFLYSSFVTDILIDENNRMTGVVISNRSGRQAIKAKVVIDATPYATVARTMNLPFRPFKAGNTKFTYCVVGNEKKQEMSPATHSAPFALSKKPVPVLTYRFHETIEQDTFGEVQKIEQRIRDRVWAPNQMDSADDLVFTPSNPIISQQPSRAQKIEDIGLKSLAPKSVDNFYVLNGYADIPRDLVADFIKPCHLMTVAEKVADAAFKKSRQKAFIMPEQKSDDRKTITGNFKNSFDFIRPTYVHGDVDAVEKPLPVLGEYDVLVIGGGTAGAPAGIGAAQQGAKTLVVEYLHGLGGTGTLGLIGSYYHGYRDGYTHKVDVAVRDFGGVDHPRNMKKLSSWNRDWKMEYFRSELRKAGADIWFGAIGIGALVRDKSVRGVVLATPFGKGVVLAKNVIDSTGSADIAIAAGAYFTHTDKECLAVQGAGLPPVFDDRSYNNTDWTFINDTDVIDVWRTFVTGKKKYDDGYYDVGKLPQTRERRRIVGEHQVSVLDFYNNRTYPDTVSIHKSSFDTHGFTIDPYFNLKPPKGSSIDEVALVPLRSLLPKGLENIIVTGLGASADRDAMPVIRMQPCLQNQGYTVGHIAAQAVKDGVGLRYVDLFPIQQKMVKLGSLPASILTAGDNYPPTRQQMQQAVTDVVNELDSLELLLWDTPKGLALLKEAYHSASDKKARLTYAHVLATYGVPDGWEILAQNVASIKSWDKGWRYRGMGQFGACMSPLDSMIIALGRTKNKNVLPVIYEKAQLLEPDHEFSHFRAVAVALEYFHEKDAADVLYQLLQMDGVQGHAVTNIKKARLVTDENWTNTAVRNDSLRELVLARALYRTGDKKSLGKKILTEYANDLKGHYARHALDVLISYA